MTIPWITWSWCYEFCKISPTATYPLWCRGRKSHSRELFERILPPQLSSRKSPQSSNGRPSWECTKHGRSQGQTGSERWWSLLHLFCWPWTAGAEWQLIPGRWKMSTKSGCRQDDTHSSIASFWQKYNQYYW